ncbi:hypothetical protein HU200_048479 [Digitaria exilis]|uniref:Uncharacterized protein n=1 Tax=Digitaria exilis TaxID=1010633 RepID=A0A835B0N9_9POAL|nr:hypothetical protein HU200_048479 [Digitaria exilis]
MPVALLPFKAYTQTLWVVGVFLDGASLAGRRRAAPAARPDQGALRQDRLPHRVTGALPPLDNAVASPWLRHPLVSHNQLIGSLNISLGALLTFRAEHNGFRGGLEALRVPSLRSFNVSGNKLAGEISGDLSMFLSSSFAGNLALCGQPLPRRVRAYHASKGASAAAPGFEDQEDLRANDDDRCQKSGGLVCFDGGEELRLESLLKASAEVLGKGVSGRTYKAVLEDGIVVLRQPDCRSKAFDRHMRLVGRLRHVVSLRGYCNSNGERLLVCNFLPNGRLQSLLQATGTLLLSLQVAWRREKPGLGGVEEHRVGRGAGTELHPHVPGAAGAGARERGAVQVTNILLDERGGACVSECGVMRYATNIQQPTCRRRRWCLWRRCRRVAGIR